MMKSTIRRARQTGFGLAMTWLGISTAGAAEPARRVAVNPDVRITEADVRESNKEIEEAYSALVHLWTEDFRKLGREFVAPRIFNYRGNVRSACGILSANNAVYCSATNAIYFDEVFVTRQRHEAAQRLGTDGDMAGVGIIAHEMGHAVAFQLGFASRIPYQNEAAADCLAGVFAKASEANGSLEPGDLDEALAGMAAAGDPEVELTGNARIDARRQQRMAVLGHGTPEQRMSNFQAGFDTGIRGCFPRSRG